MNQENRKIKFVFNKFNVIIFFVLIDFICIYFLFIFIFLNML